MAKPEQPATHGGPNDRHSLDVTAGGILDLAEHALLQLLDAMFDDADDILFGLSLAEGSADEHACRINALRVLRLGRARIREDYHRALLRRLRGGDPDGACLPGCDEIDSLADTIVRRAIAAQRLSLFELETRLAWLAARHSGAPQRQALSPQALYRVFREALVSMRLAAPVQTLLHKLYDLLVLGRLGPVYAVLNDFLEERSVLPTFDDVLASAFTQAHARGKGASARQQKAVIHRFPTRPRDNADD